jgi:hypothetical protein
MTTIGALAALTVAAWPLGAAALAGLPWPELRRFERAALELTAGFGLVALILSSAVMLGWFTHSSLLLIAAAIAAAGVAFLRGRPRPGAHPSPDSRQTRFAGFAIAICAIVACAGALAPVTDVDALSYVLPIAHHIADEGALRVWSDQAPSMWPQAHQVLLAYMIGAGSDRLGALTALEWLIAIGAVSALARRVCERANRVPLAVALAVAAPVTAFQVAAAKEDIILLAATAAALFCLAGPMTIGEAAAAGLFAGIAASVKYPGLGVAVAVVGWIAIASHAHRVRRTVAAFGCAVLVAGVWYALNLWRFGNPTAPFVFGAAGTPLNAEAVRAAMDNYGGGRSAWNLVVTPLRIFAEPARYCGRAMLFHPLTYAGAAALFVPRLRRRAAPLLFAAGVLYVGWYLTLQNARLLLPAAMLLAPSAADLIAPAMTRSRGVAAAAIAAVAVPLLLAPTVGVIRAARYLSDPARYLERETEHFADIEWANAHLNPKRHRILSMFGAVAFFTVPAMGLDPLHQVEIAASEISPPERLIAACRRQGITHVLTARHDLAGVESQLRLVYENRASRLGGVHFFRAAPVEETAIFEILPGGTALPTFHRSAASMR